MRSIPTFAFLSFAHAVFAQPACELTLRGRVVDDHDGSPLEMAEVRFVEPGMMALTDDQGVFVLEGLCPGRHVLRVAHLGCDPVEVAVDLPMKGELVVHMEHHAEELRALEVARKRPDEAVGQATQVLDRMAMQQEAGRGLGEMLVRVPGVTLLQSGPTIGKPVIHGLSGNRVLIMNQGIRQEDQQWGGEHAPSLDPLSSDRITVVKGAASVQYGSDAIGGVIITEPVELPREGAMTGELRLLGALNGRGGGGSGLLQGGVRRLRGFGWRMQASGRYLGDSEAARYVLSNTGLREIGASAAIGYRDLRWTATAYYSRFMRDVGILRAAHIGNLTDLRNAIDRGEPWYVAPFTHAIDVPRQSVVHHLFRTEVGHAVSERDRVVLTYAYQANDRQEYDIRRGGRSGIPALDLFLATHTGEVALKHWIGSKLHGRAGVNGLLQENSNIPGTGVRPLIPNYRRTELAAFIVEHLPLNDRVELEAGARVSSTHLLVARYDEQDVLQRPEHDFVNHALSLGASWVAADSLHIRFNISSAFRPPHVSELYSEGLHHGAAAIEEGDDRLRSERAWRAVLDVGSASRDGRWNLDATVHASLINDFIYLRPDGLRLTVRGAFPVFTYVATDASLVGADLALRHGFAAHWSWALKGSTVRGRDRSADQWLFLMPADRLSGSLRFMHRQLGPWNSVEAELACTAVFLQERIPVGVDLADPPPAYQLVGLSIAATRPIGRDRLHVGVRADNLLNTAYRDLLDRFRYYADARGRDITLWVTYAFGQR